MPPDERGALSRPCGKSTRSAGDRTLHDHPCPAGRGDRLTDACDCAPSSRIQGQPATLAPRGRQSARQSRLDRLWTRWAVSPSSGDWRAVRCLQPRSCATGNPLPSRRGLAEEGYPDDERTANNDSNGAPKSMPRIALRQLNAQLRERERAGYRAHRVTNVYGQRYIGTRPPPHGRDP